MKKALVNQSLCVACGCCQTTCKRGAISIPKGIYAIIDKTKCVGCGLCANSCPGSFIEIMEIDNNE